MISPGSKRVCQRVGAMCRTGACFATANTANVPGAALMTFFTIVTLRRIQTTAGLFMWSHYGAGGWLINETAAAIDFRVRNSTPADVTTPTFPIVPSMVGVPLICMARYNGTLNPAPIEGWVNGVSTGVTSLGTGYTAPVALPVLVAANSAAGGNRPWWNHAQGLLEGYDVVASYNNPLYGTGAAGLTAEWAEALQQGRDLPWPRAMTVADYYWDAKDVVAGTGTKVSWTDRGPNAQVIPRSGNAPDGGSFPMVF